MTRTQANEAIRIALESYFASTPNPTSEGVRAIYEFWMNLISA